MLEGFSTSDKLEIWISGSAGMKHWDKLTQAPPGSYTARTNVGVYDICIHMIYDAVELDILQLNIG